MATILFVRITSSLEPEELERRMLERLPRFREVPGLLQKVYVRDNASDAVCGIYFFADEASLARFRDSELARTIAGAYEAVDVRRETFEVLRSLWPERGPLAEPGAASD